MEYLVCFIITSTDVSFQARNLEVVSTWLITSDILQTWIHCAYTNSFIFNKDHSVTFLLPTTKLRRLVACRQKLKQKQVVISK